MDYLKTDMSALGSEATSSSFIFTMRPVAEEVCKVQIVPINLQDKVFVASGISPRAHCFHIVLYCG